MNKMHQKFVVPKKKEHNPIRMASISSIPSVPIENSESTDNKEEEIKSILEKYHEFMSTNSLENIKGDLEEYKKITDERIEKLVNLFLSIK